MQEEKKIYLAILNITSWAGQCSDADHVYGTLILSEREAVTVDNVEEWNIKYLGENIEVKQTLTPELAKRLDERDGGNSNRRLITEYQDNPTLATTSRFYTFQQVVNAGIETWKTMKLDCPFISLYEGRKYIANEFESSNTVIIKP